MWKREHVGYSPFDFVGVSPRVAEMKVPYTVVEPTNKKKKKRIRKKNHGNICGVFKSAGKVCTAFSSSHSHPSTIFSPTFRSLDAKTPNPKVSAHTTPV